MEQDELRINGTLIWYYYICPREVWLMARQITPDEHDENVEWGRYLHEHSYARSRKEVEIESSKLDIVSVQEGKLVVSEIKKTERYKKSATMQLLYYLLTLKKAGIEARGELRFPELRRKETVELTPEAEDELAKTIEEIRAIASRDRPPTAKKIKYCQKCAYQEMCWA